MILVAIALFCGVAWADFAPKVDFAPKNDLSDFVHHWSSSVVGDLSDKVLHFSITSDYKNLKSPFDAKVATSRYFFITQKPAQPAPTPQKPHPKYSFTSQISPQLLSTQMLKPSVTIKGRGRTKTGMLLNDILLDSTQNRLLNNSIINEVSISQGYALSLDSPLLENIEFVGGYATNANNEHRLNAQFGSDMGLWDWWIGYNFSNTDLYGAHARSLDSQYTNHAFRAKFGLNSGESHKYSINFTYQKGEKRGLLTNDGEVENVWNSPQYDTISAYILGNSKFNERVFLKSKFYYDSFVNVSKMERTWGDSSVFYANKPYSNMTNNYSFGVLETLQFVLDDNIDLRLGVNLKSDNRKYISTVWSAENELSTNQNDFSDLYTTIFAEYSHAFGDRMRFVLNGSYDRNDALKSIANNVARDNFSLEGWTLQGILYVDLSKYWTLYINAMKNSLVPTLKEIRTSSCGVKTMNPYSLQSTFVYGIGTCLKW